MEIKIYNSNFQHQCDYFLSTNVQGLLYNNQRKFVGPRMKKKNEKRNACEVENA